MTGCCMDLPEPRVRPGGHAALGPRRGGSRCAGRDDTGPHRRRPALEGDSPTAPPNRRQRLEWQAVLWHLRRSSSSTSHRTGTSDRYSAPAEAARHCAHSRPICKSCLVGGVCRWPGRPHRAVQQAGDARLYAFRLLPQHPAALQAVPDVMYVVTVRFHSGQHQIAGRPLSEPPDGAQAAAAAGAANDPELTALPL